MKLIKDVLNAEKKAEENICKSKENALKEFNLKKEKLIGDFNCKIDMSIAKNKESIQELNTKLKKKFVKDKIKYDKKIQAYDNISDKEIEKIADKTLSILVSDMK